MVIGIKHNVKHMSVKSWLGFTEVNFVDYQCTHKTFKLASFQDHTLESLPQSIKFMIELFSRESNVVAVALSRLLMLLRIVASQTMTLTNAPWRMKQFFSPSFQPDNFTTLALNGVFDDINVLLRKY